MGIFSNHKNYRNKNPVSSAATKVVVTDSDIEKLRNIPLTLILEGMFKAPRDPEDKNRRWLTERGKITVSGMKFHNHSTGEGGGGAIDLVMHLDQCDFRDAVTRLRGVDESTVTRARVAEKRKAGESEAQKPMPALSERPEAIARVRRYLVGNRNIDGALVDQLIESGQIGAQEHNGIVNAAFELVDTSSGQKIGIEIRGGVGTKFHRVAGQKGMFVIALGDGPWTRSVFVESAIESLSYATLNPEQMGYTRVIGTAGSTSERLVAAAKAEAAAGREIIAAFNQDGKGPQSDLIGGAILLPPHPHNDWNDFLVRQHQNLTVIP
jgi:hypothetical protein